MSFCQALTSPLPLDPLPENKIEDRRLWIGNLDPRITEFDLLFHRSGPSAGQPRGYAFVTFKETEDAKKAKECLDGKMVGTKKLAVRWANSVNKDEIDKPKPKLEIPALAGAKSENKISREITIQAIEAKLKMMEHSNSDDFKINNVPCGSLFASKPPVIRQTSVHTRGRGRHEMKLYRKPVYKR